MTGNLDELLPLLRCPSCGGADARLAVVTDGLTCDRCNSKFPVHQNGSDRIPWLFAAPGDALAEWRARINGFVETNASEQARMGAALADVRISKTGQNRIRRLLRAKRVQRSQVRGLLAPLGLEDAAHGAPQQPTASLTSKLPKNQGLTNYYANIFRDWAWNNRENEHLANAVAGVLKCGKIDRLGKILTLGAGACRLAYDMHREYDADLSVALDINPLLLFLASRVIDGEEVPLYEFPIAPLNEAAFAALQRCRAPVALDRDAGGKFLFVCADGMNPPFADASFDTIVTPWLIDIIPHNLRDFIPRVNRLLKNGGTWVNTGSLAFFHSDESWCYSQEEVLELLENNGFRILSTTREDIPYLQSPLSAHKRTESVLSFSVRKIADIDTPQRLDYLPEWMLDTTRPIPEMTEFVVASSHHLLQTQALAAIDGERTIDEIGSLVATRYGLQIGDATHAVKRILLDVYEGAIL